MQVRLLPLALAAVLATGCRVVNIRKVAYDPVVIMHTPGAGELGVATDYGVVFLGRGAKSGPLEFTAWFGDGPSLEVGLIEAVRDGLYTTDSEIRLPAVPITFETPPAGSVVLVRGRRGGTPWEMEVPLLEDPRVEGLLLPSEGPLAEMGDDQTGAGVFVFDPDGRLWLLGLVSGRLTLTDEDGQRELVTAIGPETLWRLVTHRRNSERPRRFPYRDDLL